MAKHEVIITKDLEQRKLTVIREFDAPLNKVWDAWTQGALLDKWWAPRPYRAETRSMDFREGGRWLYCMVGPTGDRTWCGVDFSSIVIHKSFTNAVLFCDEAGVENKDFPKMYWSVVFTEQGNTTKVTAEISFDRTADMETIIQMGFEAGYTMGLNNLEEFLVA